MSSTILIGDCRERLKELPDASVDSVVCDPPYHLTAQGSTRTNLSQPADKDLTKINAGAFRRMAKGFMGQTWDGGDVAFQPETWAEVLRVLKPGGHLIAFSGTRTYHRMVCAIEDAGFEVRDQLAWVYGSGFPKSLDVSKQIDKMAGAEREVVGEYDRRGRHDGCKRSSDAGGNHGMRAHVGAVAAITAPATDSAREWQGWGTALKPSWEPICLARKPLVGTVAQNVLTHGTGALNIDGCRIEGEVPSVPQPSFSRDMRAGFGASEGRNGTMSQASGRWPANLCHDGSDEVLAGFPDARSAGIYGNERNRSEGMFGTRTGGATFDDEGSAARFFYTAKATTAERGEGNTHPTVKPVALMRWLVRLVTPKGGTVLDPFMGSGSTLLAAEAEQFNSIGCEMSEEYAAIAERRLKDAGGMFSQVEVSRIEPTEAAA